MLNIFKYLRNERSIEVLIWVKLIHKERTDELFFHWCFFLVGLKFEEWAKLTYKVTFHNSMYSYV